MLVDVAVDALQDVLPSIRRNLGRGFSLPPSISALGRQTDRRGIAIGRLFALKNFVFVAPRHVFRRG